MSALDTSNKSRGKLSSLTPPTPESSSPEPPPQTVPAAWTRSGDRGRDSPILAKQPYGTARGPGVQKGKDSNFPLPPSTSHLPNPTPIPDLPRRTGE